MSDATTPIAVVAIITAFGSLATIIFKYVRHSECLGGLCKFDTRTPPATPAQTLAPPPSPINPNKNDKNKTGDNIKEVEV